MDANTTKKWNNRVVDYTWGKLPHWLPFFVAQRKSKKHYYMYIILEIPTRATKKTDKMYNYVH